MKLKDYLDLIGAVLITVGLLLNWMQMRADHERARREKAVEYILSWARNVDRRGTLARKLVETFSFEQCKSLINQEAFEVGRPKAVLVEGIFGEMPEERDGKYQLDLSKSAELRWMVVSYLNNLEAIISGWRHHVADRQIIAEQFKFLVSPSNGHFILEEFRKAAGLDNYPAIEEFAKERKEEYDSASRPKPRRKVA